MERLWATWRMSYITGEKNKDGCIFCNKPQEDNDEENLILHKGKFCFIIMNLFPYNNGHIMVIPYRHIDSIILLTEEESIEMMYFIKLMTKVIKNTMSPEGFNIGMNLGQSGGAGIAEHIHMHIVPRWAGDTNFMPVISDTRVISEHIKDTYKKLKKALLEEI